MRIPKGGGTPRTVMRVPGVDTGAGEGGLLGLAVSPDYAKDRLVYAYFTSDSDNRIVRFRLGGSPEPIVTGHRARRHPQRRADRLRARRQALRRRRRDRQHRAGPGPRLAERQDPADEPGRERPGGQPVRRLARLVARPPQRAGPGLGPLRDACGRPSSARTRLDEVNLIRKGRNYGWPTVEGRGDTQGGQVHQPGRHLEPDVDVLAERRRDRRHDALRRRAAVASCLWQIPLERHPRRQAAQAACAGRYGRLRTVVRAPDGSLWVATSNRDGRGTRRTATTGS